jgi:hypothetical protein
MRKPADLAAAADAVNDNPHKRYHHQWTDRRAAKGDPAGPVAEGDEDG